MNGGKENESGPAIRFGQRDNQLQVGGRKLTELATQVGTTPFYAYDRELIKDRVNELRAMLPTALHLHYAVKANPMPALVQLLSGLTDGLDVASLAEMQLAIDTGVAPELISFAGPGKSDRELAGAVAAGVIINMESEGEMRRITAIGEKQGRRPVVSIRVNPAFELKTSGMKMGGGPKPFGIDEERVPALLEDIASRNLDFCGFHIFGGSQNLRTEAIVESQCKTLDLALRLADSSSLPIRWLNIGGGLGVPYFPGDRPLDLEPIASNLEAICERAARELPDATLVMELGRYLVAEAGVYVSEVIDRKESRGEIFLITNGGLHHHLAASGNFGQVIRRNYPVCLGNRLEATAMEQVTVVGPLCTPLDILADKVTLPRAEPGDLVVLFQSGAYGFSASPHLFLSHPLPAQVLV